MVAMNSNDVHDNLIQQATTARNLAYAPYSNFKVGAALLTQSGKIITGCNVENISYTPTVCAERTAIFKAISEGEMIFSKIAVVTGDSTPSPPCGVCRQVLGEFVDDEFEIILATTTGKKQVYTYADLFPVRFVPNTTIGKNDVWYELRKIIQRDGIISDDEFELVSQILDDMDRLEEEINTLSIDDTFDDADRKIILELRRKVYDSAKLTADLDDMITDEEKEILVRLAEVLNINQ